MKTTILVIEDEKKIATLVAKNLEAAGYAVTLAEDGESGLRAFDKAAENALPELLIRAFAFKSRLVDQLERYVALI